MAKIDPNFPHDMYRFITQSLRDIDASDGDDFIERFFLGPQSIFEDTTNKINSLLDIISPATTRDDLVDFLLAEVGFTRELSNITQDLSISDKRKLASVAVPLWRSKGPETGYQNIVRLFTGKSVRVFNYFDFRLIVGEKAFGEEQLGEDSWLISVPGVEASNDQSNNVVDLLPFDGNAKDRSLSRNDSIVHGPHGFFTAPSSGFPQNASKYLRLQGGTVSQPNSIKYDLSGDFTIELYFRMQTSQPLRTLFDKTDLSGRGVKIEINSSTNEITVTLSDSINTVNQIFTPTLDIDDNQPRHLALVVDRTNDARVYIDGTESLSIALGSVGDMTNSSPVLLGASSIGLNPLEIDISNFRLALNAVYDVTSSTLTPPITGFIEFQEELLDEFQTDVRIVDEGDLNKILMLRILNLMRPGSERINAIFIRFFEDFTAGSGRFIHLSGTSRINVDEEFEIDPNSIVVTDVLGDTEFQDIVLQSKANDTLTAGGEFSVLFHVQDIQNFYEYRIDTVNRELSVHKTVGGVSTQIAPNVPVDIVPTASYIFTVNTNFDPINNEALLQTFFDSNRIHQVKDSSFQKGKFGYKTSSTTTIEVGEIEMIETPLDVRKISPGFSL